MGEQQQGQPAADDSAAKAVTQKSPENLQTTGHSQGSRRFMNLFGLCARAEAPDQYPGLSVEERAKLDYSHRLMKKGVWLDKGILAIVGLLLVGVFSFVLEAYKSAQAEVLEAHKREQAQVLSTYQDQLSKTLEDHRSKLAMQQYMAQKRYEGMHAVMESYSVLFNAFIAYMRKGTTTTQERNDYRELINKVVETNNKYDLAVPREFEQQVEKCLFMHRGLVVKKFAPEYQDFIIVLSVQLKESAQKTLNPDSPEARGSALDALPTNRTDELAAKYLDSHLKGWRGLKR
jgi:hypothetical protein